MSWLDTFTQIRSTDWSKVPEPEREEKAREVVTITAYASAAAAMVPVPFVDLALLLPFHSAMVMTVGHVLGRNVSEAEAKRVALELGAVAGVTVAARAGLTALKKLVLPGVGGVLAAPASFAATWALGRVTIAYFKDPELSREELRGLFKQAMKEAGQHFSKERLDRFRQKERAEGNDPTKPPVSPTEPAPSAEAEAASEPPAPASDAPRPGAPLSAVEPEPSEPGPAESPSEPPPSDGFHRRKRSL